MAEDGGTRPALSATLTLGRCVMAARRLWIFFRYTRWLLWLATIGRHLLGLRLYGASSFF